MAQTAVTKKDYYQQNRLNVLRVTALGFPIIILAVGLLTRAGFLNRQSYHSDVVFGLIVLAFTFIAILQYVKSAATQAMHIFYTTTFHVLSILFVLYVIGFNNPIVLAWVLLSISTDLFLGRKALFLSIMAFALTGVLYLTIFSINNTQVIMNSLSIVGIVTLVSYVASYLRQINQSEHEAHNKTQQLQRLQKDRLTTLINAMNDAVITTDSKGIVRMYNAASLNLLDTNQSLSGTSLDSILNLYNDDDEPVNAKDIFKNKGRTVRRDLAHKYKDGESIDLYISIAPIRPSYRQHTQQGYIVVLRDITNEKSLEEERDEFISVVSHELRTPIAITEGELSNVKLLLERGGDPKSLAKVVDSAHDQVLYLAKMINDLSTLSRAERGVADVAEPISVNDMIQALYNEYRPQAEAKKLALNLDLHGKVGDVFASRLYLEEVLQNFITNAIKYTHSGSVTIGARKVGKSSVEFSVKDTGIGVSKADQKHIFEKFYRSEDYRTRETNGTGLGLYVVQKLAQKLKISIEISSRLNYGTTFSFVMPITNAVDRGEPTVENSPY